MPCMVLYLGALRVTSTITHWSPDKDHLRLINATILRYDGVGLHDNNSEFWQLYPAIVAHRRKVGALPPIREYYAQPHNQDVVRAFFAQAGVEGLSELPEEEEQMAVAQVARL